MKIADLLSSAAIAGDLKSTGKNEVLAELTDAIVRVTDSLDREEVIRVLQERELLGSTGIGEGVAIPHGKLKDIDQLLLSFGRSRGGVDFDSMDGKPAHIFIMTLSPENRAGPHIQFLAEISRALSRPDLREKLLNAASADEILNLLTV